MLTLWVSKDAEFYVDFKNIYLPNEKMHKKKLVLKNLQNWDFSWISPNLACFFRKHFFKMHFVTKVSFYCIFENYVKLCVFWYPYCPDC
jgi:hypothetical protein